MKVKEIMTGRPIAVAPKTTLVEVAQLMQKHDVGVVPVCQGENLVGLITDRDIVVRNIAHRNDPQTTMAQDVMTSAVTTITSDMSLSQAAGMMAAKQVRRLPVVDDGRLVGMLSLGDLATKAKFDVEISSTLGDISIPSEPEQV